MPAIDDELGRRFAAAAGRDEPGERVLRAIDMKRRRRAIRLRVYAAALTACVLAGTVGSYALLQRAFRTDTTVPLDGGPTASGASGASPGDPVTPAPAEGRDIGIGTNVCDSALLDGLDLVPGGALDIAWTGYLVNDEGNCPSRNISAQRWVAAVDVDGDGIADTWVDLPDVCSYNTCSPFDATDLDADGDEELIVITTFSIVDHLYLSVTHSGGTPELVLLRVAEPGHLAAGIVAGRPLLTSAAGDAGFSAWIRCETYPERPVLVYTWMSEIVDSQEPAEWHEVKLQLQADGLFHVLDSADLRLPPGQDPGLERSDAPACGVDFNPWAPPNP